METQGRGSIDSSLTRLYYDKGNLVNSLLESPVKRPQTKMLPVYVGPGKTVSINAPKCEVNTLFTLGL